MVHLVRAEAVEGRDGPTTQAENHLDEAAEYFERKDTLVGVDENRKEQGRDDGNHLLFHGAH